VRISTHIKLGFVLFLVALQSSCGGAQRPFPDRPPMWSDPDQAAFSPKPEEYWSPFGWDAADHTIFRPISRFFAVDPAGEATNVNALDEVPDSSWFANRIGRFGMTPEQVERGACNAPLLAPVGPWTVKGAKPNGANPGFIIKAADGRRYLLKFDGTLQGERATTADVLGSRIYHAIGYHAPCNSVVFFDKSILTIDPEATSENSAGHEVPLTWKDINKVLAKAYRLPDGRYRASGSLFLPGMPIGPWTYQGTRDDDPNDVVPHEDRRELRGGYVLASWLNHFDTREQNTLAIWVERPDGKGHVRHYMLDFGDCLGSLWDQEGISRRLGHAYYLDIPYLAQDAITLGLVSHPWEDPQFGVTGPVLGYFGVERFVPDQYRTGYPNPAFIRASERDSAWMARIIADFDHEHLKAALAPARVQDELTRSEILRILQGRRTKLLRRWLSRVSPVSHPRVELAQGDKQLCLRDLAVSSGVVEPTRQYRARAWIDEAPRPAAVTKGASLGELCVALSSDLRGSANAPAYVAVEVTIVDEAAPPTPLRVYLYDRGNEAIVVGLER
jgi:hypothetical protein